MIGFFVPGRPQPKGSWIPIQNRKTGKTYFVPDNKRSKPWETTIKLLAQSKKNRLGLCSNGPWLPAPNPVQVRITFYYRRPKTHYKTKANQPDQERLSTQGAQYRNPTARNATPDIDKLARAVLDAMTGILYEDDCQVASIFARKEWADQEGADIQVEPLP